MCDMIRIFGEEISCGERVQSTKALWTWNVKGVADGITFDKGRSYKGWTKHGFPIKACQYDALNTDKTPGAQALGGWIPLKEDELVTCIYRKTGDDTGEFLILVYPTDNPGLGIKKTPGITRIPKPTYDLVIETAHISYKGPGKHIDCTAKAKSIFAPQWDMVYGIKKGSMTEKEYTERYHALMLASYKKYKELWLKAIREEHIVLKCYCKVGDFCHRPLLATYIRKVAEANGLTVHVKGEV